jgi:hypothetical protein
MMICTVCGVNLPKGGAFCPACGIKTGAAPARLAFGDQHSFWRLVCLSLLGLAWYITFPILLQCRNVFEEVKIIGGQKALFLASWAAMAAYMVFALRLGRKTGAKPLSVPATAGLVLTVLLVLWTLTAALFHPYRFEDVLEDAMYLSYIGGIIISVIFCAASLKKLGFARDVAARRRLKKAAKAAGKTGTAAPKSAAPGCAAPYRVIKALMAACILWIAYASLIYHPLFFWSNVPFYIIAAAFAVLIAGIIACPRYMVRKGLWAARAEVSPAIEHNMEEHSNEESV